MTRFLLTVTLLFLFAASARALQWPWPIGWIGDDNEGVQQPRNRRGVVERSEDEWGTGSMDRQGWTPSWMQERTPWTEMLNPKEMAYQLDAARRSLLSPFHVKTTKGHYIALLDIPGIPRNNINVTLLPASSLLRVRGEIKCSAAEEGTSFCLSRSVSHDVTLPWDADLEKGVEVGVKDGVLRIAVHRKDKTGDWKVLQVAEDTWQAATSAAGEAISKGTDTVKAAGAAATRAAGDAAASATEAVKQAAGYAKDTASAATEAAKQAAGYAKDTAESVAENVQEAAGGARKVVEQAAGGSGGNEGARTVKPTQA